MDGKVRLKYSQTYPGKVWQMIADNEGKRLVIEVRSHQKQQVSWCVYDFSENKIIAENITLKESWWAGLVAMSGDQLYLHVYDDPDKPEEKSYFAWDISQAHTASVVLQEHLPERENNFIITPFYYPAETPYFDTVKKYIERVHNVSPLQGLDYYENEEQIIISYYLSKNSKLVNNLLVLDHEGEVLLNATLAEGLDAISDNTFFLYHSSLIFVKNKTELYIYALTANEQ